MTAIGRLLRARSVQLALVAIGAAAVTGIVYAAGVLDSIERSTIDTRFDLRGAQGSSDRIVIVALDPKSTREIGIRGQIPRSYYARVLDRLHDAGARVLAVDVGFKGVGPARDDRALLTAIARDGPVILGTLDAPSSHGTGAPVPVFKRLREPPGGILASTAVDADRDGVLRRMLYRQVVSKTLAVRAAELFEGGRPSSANDFPQNHAWIDFRGPPGTFDRLSLIDVYRGHFLARDVRGKAVLIGVTDPTYSESFPDIFPTDISSIPMPGVEVHANALDTILRRLPLKSAGSAVNVLLVLLLAAFPAACAILTGRSRHPRVSEHVGASVVLLSIGAALLFLIVAQLAFNSGWIVSVVYPVLALGLSAAGAASLSAAPSFALSDLFISYRRLDSEYEAHAIHDRLVERFGKRSVFMDTGSIAAGQEWPQRIKDAVAGCKVMLVLIGRGWLSADPDSGRRRIDDPGDWVRLEVELGLRSDKVTIVPVLLGHAIMPSERELPESIRALASRHAIPVQAATLKADVDRLADSIRAGRLEEYERGAIARTVEEPQ